MDNSMRMGVLGSGHVAGARAGFATGSTHWACSTASPPQPLDAASGMAFRLNNASPLASSLLAERDAISLCDRFGLDPIDNPDDLEREILLAMAMSPVSFGYLDYDELASAVRIRKNIVAAARKATLAFDTTAAAERPADYWTYSRERGFTVLPGKSLIEALRRATQPEVSGSIYDFSCYRTTEYVFCLA